MSEQIVVTAIDKAVPLALRFLGEAKKAYQQTQKYNVIACINYLEAARAAIRGLEEELDEILIEAGQISSFYWDRRAETRERIGRYLNVDRLRPIIHDALEGMVACHKFASENVKGFLHWPGQRAQKAEAVDDLLRLIGGLSEYLSALNGKMSLGRVNYAGGSGIMVDELVILQSLLDDSDANVLDDLTRRTNIKRIVKTSQAKRQRHGLPIAAEGKRVIQELAVAFRLAAS